MKVCDDDSNYNGGLDEDDIELRSCTAGRLATIPDCRRLGLSYISGYL